MRKKFERYYWRTHFRKMFVFVDENCRQSNWKRRGNTNFYHDDNIINFKCVEREAHFLRKPCDWSTTHVDYLLKIPTPRKKKRSKNNYEKYANIIKIAPMPLDEVNTFFIMANCREKISPLYQRYNFTLRKQKKISIIGTKCQRIVCNCAQKKSIIYFSSINSHKCSQFSLQCESKIRITKCKNNTNQKNRENHHFKLICTTNKQLTKALIKICTELCVSVCAVMCCALA